MYIAAFVDQKNTTIKSSAEKKHPRMLLPGVLYLKKDLIASNRASVTVEGSCCSFVFLCRVHCKFSILQYFF